VAAHAVVAFEPHHHHGRSRLFDGVADRRLEAGAIGYRAVDETVKARDLREIQA
jgi:hypothetical protein